MAETDGAWLDDFLQEWHSRAPAAVQSSLAPDLFAKALPAGYWEATPPTMAAWDLSALSGPRPRFSIWPVNEAALGAAAAVTAATAVSPVTAVSAGTGEGAGAAAPDVPVRLRVRRAGWERVELSSWLPVVERLGLAVVEAVPWHIRPQGGDEAFVDDLAVRVAVPLDRRDSSSSSLAARLVEAIEATMAGSWEPDLLAQLVVSAGLSWREVDLLGSVVGYRRLVGGDRAADKAAAMGASLVQFPDVAAALVAYFRALHGPSGAPVAASSASVATTATDPAARPAAAAEAAQQALSAVPDLGHYEALKDVFSVMSATVRSTWPGANGVFAVKLESAGIEFLPEPRPWREAMVWSSRFEGLHLRFGPVARGGLRWSERSADLRTEVLGLARAQVKKNSLIVPTGAKGGFVLKPDPAGRREGEQFSGREAYAAFVDALLDVTDAQDPYLVVAPDKGTGTFSDLANELSEQRGFWLGDAFASGGSQGYDHRALGITARGAWLAVQRHFLALGLDPATDTIRVVGVGDMSGDVFGNAMLQSEALHLVAAFDHRHIFVDPAPSPEMAYEERLRLSRLPGSSWADYDLDRASPGAVVVPRNVRSVDVPEQAAAAIGLRAGQCSPDELVRAVLRAPADLLFFGGIGTFVKAPSETAGEVDDRANDDVRVGSDELRARAVVEGANLAMTQRARVAYSRRGGRVNTDFVDNAGGVAMSDREVNLKILLGAVDGTGRLDREERNSLLAGAAQEMARAVLDDVAGGIVALDRASAESAARLPAYRALMEDLEAAGLLNPQVEGMPGPDELERRQAAGAGFARPELAVLTAFARSELARAIEASDLSRSPLDGYPAPLSELVSGYFPSAWRERFAGAIADHPLFRQLAASRLANEMIAGMGPLWAHELAAESGVSLSEVAPAYWAAARILDASRLHRLVEEGSSDVEPELRRATSDALDWLARWRLWSHEPTGPDNDIAGERLVADELEAMGAPAAESFAEACARRGRAAEVAEVVRGTGGSAGEAYQALQRAGDVLRSPALAVQLSGYAGGDRWAAWHARQLEHALAQAQVQVAVRAVNAGWQPGPGGTAEGPRASSASAEEALGAQLLAHCRWLVSRVSAEAQLAQVPAERSGQPQAGHGQPGNGLALAALAVRAAQRVAGRCPAAVLVDAMSRTD